MASNDHIGETTFPAITTVEQAQIAVEVEGFTSVAAAQMLSHALTAERAAREKAEARVEVLREEIGKRDDHLAGVEAERDEQKTLIDAIWSIYHQYQNAHELNDEVSHAAAAATYALLMKRSKP